MVLMWHIIGDMRPCANVAGLGFCLHVWQHHPLMKVTSLELGTCHHQTWEHWCTPNKVYYLDLLFFHATFESIMWKISIVDLWLLHDSSTQGHILSTQGMITKALLNFCLNWLIGFCWVSFGMPFVHKHIWQGFQLHKVCRILVELHICCTCLRK